MIEHIEESVLGPLTLQVLDVVHDQHVDSLVESDEIHDAVSLVGVHILGLELVPAYIEHLKVLETLFDVNADGLRNVRLAQSRATEEKERIERGFSGSLRNAFRGAHTQFVALPFHQIAETVNRIQPGIDSQALGARENKRTGSSGRLVSGNGHRIVGGCRCPAGGKHHSLVVLHGTHQVEELGVGPDGATDGVADQIRVSGFQILAEEVGRDLHREFGTLQGDRADALEPSVELLGINVAFDDPQTILPYRKISLLVCHSWNSNKTCYFE